jgi:ATP-dependent Lhr-like helicase
MTQQFASDRLAPELQKVIFDSGWTTLTPIQERAIPVILDHPGDIVLSAETAGGKTEAAFLPSLSLVIGTIKEKVKILYISPLKALINDQNERLKRLFDKIDVKVHSWHGDVAQSQKREVLKNPTGILQITPESLESLLVNRPGDLIRIIRNVEIIIIDEVHAFAGKDRGVHLQSILARIKELIPHRTKTIALSATIGNPEIIKSYLNPLNPEKVVVIDCPPSDKTTQYCLMHFHRDGKSIPQTLLKDLEQLTYGYKSLIFVNSKADLEESSVTLNKLSERRNHETRFLVHHASIAPALRKYVESALKEDNSTKSVLATSTLELGIDVGQIDMVVQIDSTFTVSSLKQRLGRSGRRKEKARTFMLYSTREEQLLQCMAVTDLFLKGWIEPIKLAVEPWDVFFHQALSMTRQKPNLTRESLLQGLLESGIYPGVRETSARQLIDDLIETDYLEEMEGTNELIPGLEAERLMTMGKWYSIFETPVEYGVFHQDREIGSLFPGFNMDVGVAITLGGKAWEIIEKDDTKLRFYVMPIAKGGRPQFVSGSSPIHQTIRDRVHDILTDTTVPKYIKGQAVEVLGSLRKEYRQLNLRPEERAITSNGDLSSALLFGGDLEASTLKYMLISRGVEARTDGYGHLTAEDFTAKDLKQFLEEIKASPPDINQVVDQLPEDLLKPSKYGKYLPAWAKKRLFADKYLDIPGAIELLKRTVLVLRG